jgi:hypothetical protein
MKNRAWSIGEYRAVSGSIGGSEDFSPSKKSKCAKTAGKYSGKIGGFGPLGGGVSGSFGEFGGGHAKSGPVKKQKLVLFVGVGTKSNKTPGNLRTKLQTTKSDRCLQQTSKHLVK